MKRLVSNRLGQLARTYWQPLVLSVIALLAFSQIIAWGFAAVELKKVDNLIAQTENLQSTSDVGTPDSPHSGQPNPNPSTPGSPGSGASSDQGSSDQKPKVPTKNIFKKEEFQFRLTGIYLDKAVINDQPVAVGENVGKAKLKEIGIDTVVIEEENGNTRTVDMFQGGGGGGGEGMGGPPPNPGNRGSRPGTRPSGGPNRMNRPGGMPAGIPANFSFKGMNAEQFGNMSPEEQQKFRSSLSEGERMQLREQFRQLRVRQ